MDRLKKKAFGEAKKLLTRDTLLNHPSFNKKFDIHKDARYFQLGSVISQEGKTIKFYSIRIPGP